MICLITYIQLRPSVVVVLCGIITYYELELFPVTVNYLPMPVGSTIKNQRLQTVPVSDSN